VLLQAQQAGGFKITHAPFAGGGPMNQNILGGQIDMGIGSVALLTPQVRGGKMRAIATTGEKRATTMPEVPTLTDFFVARYARKYNRPARPISDELRQLFVQYEWPGNIRELENMIKRVVILQDEQLVVREIQRNMQRTAAAATSPAGRGGRPRIGAH
jgi:hypothetical protein